MEITGSLSVKIGEQNADPLALGAELPGSLSVTMGGKISIYLSEMTVGLGREQH